MAAWMRKAMIMGVVKNTTFRAHSAGMARVLLASKTNVSVDLILRRGDWSVDKDGYSKAFADFYDKPVLYIVLTVWPSYISLPFQERAPRF